MNFRAVVLISSVILGLILAFIFKYTPPSIVEKTRIRNLDTHDIIIVVYENLTLDEASKTFYEEFPDYIIMDVFDDRKRHRIYIKAYRRDEP